MSQSIAEKVWVQEGPNKVPTAADEYIYNLGLRTIEMSFQRAVDGLTRCITLGTALSGGSLVLLKEDICYGWWKVIASSFFLAGLALALYGSTPFPKAMPMHIPTIANTYSEVAIAKQRLANISMWLLVAGLAAAIIGSILRRAIGG